MRGVASIAWAAASASVVLYALRYMQWLMIYNIMNIKSWKM